MSDGVMYHMIGDRDVDGVVALMQRIGVHFGGSKARRVLEAVARDGVRSPELVVIALATIDGVPRGLVVAFTERSRYWRQFVRHHPRAALELARHRVVQRVMRRFRGQRPPATDDRIATARALVGDRLAAPSREAWSDESLQIAKVMYVAVDPGRTQGGLGAGLYGWFFRWLRDHGYTRCDAHVSADNVPAVKLHKKFPFRFVEVPGGYFLWLPSSEIA